MSVHQQFSALATVGHPWRITDVHFTGARWVGLGERNYRYILKLPDDFSVW